MRREFGASSVYPGASGLRQEGPPIGRLTPVPYRFSLNGKEIRVCHADQDHRQAPGDLPARVLETLGVKPGDRIELQEGPDGFVLRARRIDRSRLAPLRGKLRRGKGTFDLETFRNTPHERALRD